MDFQLVMERSLLLHEIILVGLQIHVMSITHIGTSSNFFFHGQVHPVPIKRGKDMYLFAKYYKNVIYFSDNVPK